MDKNAFVKSLFLSVLFSIGVILIFFRGCGDESKQSNSDSVQKVINGYKSQADSLRGVANRLDSLLSEIRSDIDTTSDNVVKYITVYRTKHDTIEKLIACDSLAKFSEELVIRCHEQDSLHIEKENALSGAIDKYEIALDTCQIEYGILASKYEQDIGDLEFKKNRNKNIALVSSAIAVIEGLIIGVIIK